MTDNIDVFDKIDQEEATRELAAARINAENEKEAAVMAETQRQTEMTNNKNVVLDFADKLYAQMMTKDVRSINAEDRHQFVFEHFRNFYEAYPTVARHMAMGLNYRRKAFEKLLDKLATTPGGGMEGYCAVHADYVRYLFVELEKEKRHHINKKDVTNLWLHEYNTMYSAFKQIRQIEREKKSEFEREKAENLEFKKQQLLDFIETVDPATSESVNMDELTAEELRGVYKQMLALESRALDALADRNEFIRVLEEREILRNADDWIPEHVKTITKKKKNKRNMKK
jgi:hypothetical protein